MPMQSTHFCWIIPIKQTKYRTLPLSGIYLETTPPSPITNHFLLNIVAITPYYWLQSLAVSFAHGKAPFTI